MPVRSRVYTYSPSSIGAASSSSKSAMNSSASASKYSSILPTASSLSYGQYKPFKSAASSSSSTDTSRPGSFRSSPTRYGLNSDSTLSPSATTTTATGGLRSFGRYNLPSSSTSSYSPTSSYLSSSSSLNSSASSSSSSAAAASIYKPLSSRYLNTSGAAGTGANSCSSSASSAASSPAPRYSLSASSNSSLASTGAAGEHHLSKYGQYKSPSSSSSLSSSAYSSGSSAANTYSNNNYATSTSTYVPQSRRISHTSYNSPESLISRLSSSRHETAASPVTGSYLSSSGTAASRTSTTSAASSDTAGSGSLPPGVPWGLVNLGNTCYMNAALQSLYSIESIRNQLIASGSSIGDADKVLTRQLCNLFKQMSRSSAASSGASCSSSYGGGGRTAVCPDKFKYEFSHYQTKFAGIGQQDAQEFLRYLINGVHEESNAATRRQRRAAPATSGPTCGRPAPKTSQEAWSQYRDIVDDSPLVDLLVGQLCSTITCGQCQNKSHCWDPFWDLSLPLPMRVTSVGSASSLSVGAYGSSTTTYSIRDVINEFTSIETLDSDERPSCSQCKKPTKSTKQISLARLPPVLILHLKKFSNDGYKLTSPSISIDKQLTFNGVHYKLKACISHHGHSSSSGHYTSLCEYSTRWYHFDDDRVRDVTSTLDSARLKEAYVLFYTKSGAKF